MIAHRYIAATLGFAAVLTLAAAAPGRAGQPILSDPLASWPLNFGTQSTAVFAKNGAVHIAVGANSADWLTYTGFTFTDMDASLTITPNTTTGNTAGLMFWAPGNGDFFEFDVSDVSGTFAIEHHIAAGNPVWQNIVPFTKSAAIKIGGPNTLRVVTKGNSVSLFINGQSIGGLNVMAPAGGGMVGFEAEGSAKGPADYAFTNLTVSQ